MDLFKSYKNTVFGTDPKLKEHQDFTPGQRSFMDMLREMSSQPSQESLKWLMSLFSDEGFEDFERPYMEQFEQQTIPAIMERFAGMGAKSSSGLNQSLAQAGRGLSSDLAAQRGGLRMQGINALQNYGNMGLGKQTTPYIQQGKQGTIDMVAKLAPLLAML